MHRRSDRADDLARRVLTLHARNGLKIRLGVFARSPEIVVDAQPVHLAAAQHLILPNDGDVVLGLAPDDTRVAADAGIDVDRHPPPVAVVFVFGIQRQGPRRFFHSPVH